MADMFRPHVSGESALTRRGECLEREHFVASDKVSPKMVCMSWARPWMSFPMILEARVRRVPPWHVGGERPIKIGP